MALKPLNDRLIIKRVESEEKTAGGLFIPETAKEKPSCAEVIAVGSGKLLDNGTRVALEVSVGDKVFIGKYAGSEVKLNGEEFLIIREEDILAVLA